jgi:hypothetical protein
VLPSRDFHGLWESLVFDTDVKRRLTKYAGNALLFSERGGASHQFHLLLNSSSRNTRSYSSLNSVSGTPAQCP